MRAARDAAELVKENSSEVRVSSDASRTIRRWARQRKHPSSYAKKQRMNDSRYPFCSAVVVNYYTDHALLLQYYKTAQVAYLSLSYPLYTFFFII